ncbi:TPA: O132 family O-antigen polymerase, partial [Escherichia coli]|nr:O132 family O-antigen polymerase [Escherichia coli]
LFSGTFDFFSLRNILYPFIKALILVIFLFLFLLKKTQTPLYDINRLILLCFFIDSIFKVIEIMFPSVVSAWLNIISIDDWWKDTLGMRNLGFRGVSIYDYSVAATLAVLIDFSLRSRKKINFIIYPLVLLSALSSGRTGLVVIFIFTLVYFYRYAPKIIISGFIFIILIMYLSLFHSNELIHNQQLSWMFEPLLNILNGNIETESTDDLLENHLFMPDNILGYGLWGQYGDMLGSTIRGSDSGYILIILYGGWVGFIFFLICSFSYLLYAYIKSQDKKLSIAIFFTFMLIMIKGPIIYSDYNAFILMSLLIAPSFYIFFKAKENE